MHKTTDNKILTKAADIGQVLRCIKLKLMLSSYFDVYQQILQVSEDITSLRKIKEEVQKSKTPLGECLPHGLTPPTFDIVHRRFEQTRVKGTFLPNKIRTVMNDIVQYSSQLQNQQALQQQQPLNDSKVIERIIEVEEVVDFQDWMIDPLQSDSGRTIVIDDGRWDSECELLMYFPEILITAEDREEDEFEKLSQSQKTAEDDQVNSKHHALRAEGIRAGVEDETENIDDEDINMVGDDDIDEGAVDIQQEVQEQENDDQDDEGMAWLDSDDES